VEKNIAREPTMGVHIAGHAKTPADLTDHPGGKLLRNVP